MILISFGEHIHDIVVHLRRVAQLAAQMVQPMHSAAHLLMFYSFFSKKSPNFYPIFI